MGAGGLLESLPLKQGLKLSECQRNIKSKKLLESLPLKQGLKQSEPRCCHHWPVLLESLPLKQGLKPLLFSSSTMFPNPFRVTSIKTRIETEENLHTYFPQFRSFRVTSIKTRIETSAVSIWRAASDRF